MTNINRSKEFSAASNCTTNNNNINNSHIAVNNSIGKQTQNNFITNNPSSNNIISNSYLNKGNVIFLNNSKNKTDNNINSISNYASNNITNNNSKINLKGSLNFSNDYYNGGPTVLNQLPNRYIGNSKNLNFIAPAHLKNLSKGDNCIEAKSNKMNELKFNSNYVINPKSPKNEYELNKKAKSIRITLREKDIQQEILNESLTKYPKREASGNIYSKDQTDENNKQDRVKNFSKDHFKDLKSK